MLLGLFLSLVYHPIYCVLSYILFVVIHFLIQRRKVVAGVASPFLNKKGYVIVKERPISLGDIKSDFAGPYLNGSSRRGFSCERIFTVKDEFENTSEIRCRVRSLWFGDVEVEVIG